jgi:hypothetical protein
MILFAASCFGTTLQEPFPANCNEYFSPPMPFITEAKELDPSYPWQAVWQSIAPYIDVLERPYGEGFFKRRSPSWYHLRFRETLIFNKFPPRTISEKVQTVWALAIAMYEIRFTETFLTLRGGPTTLPWMPWRNPIGKYPSDSYFPLLNYARNVGSELRQAQQDLYDLLGRLQFLDPNFKPLPVKTKCMPQASLTEKKRNQFANRDPKALQRSLMRRWLSVNLLRRSSAVLMVCAGIYGTIEVIPAMPQEFDRLLHPEKAAEPFLKVKQSEFDSRFEQHLRFIEIQNRK